MQNAGSAVLAARLNSASGNQGGIQGVLCYGMRRAPCAESRSRGQPCRAEAIRWESCVCVALRAKQLARPTVRARRPFLPDPFCKSAKMVASFHSRPAMIRVDVSARMAPPPAPLGDTGRRQRFIIRDLTRLGRLCHRADPEPPWQPSGRPGGACPALVLSCGIKHDVLSLVVDHHLGGHFITIYSDFTARSASPSNRLSADIIVSTIHPLLYPTPSLHSL